MNFDTPQHCTPASMLPHSSLFLADNFHLTVGSTALHYIHQCVIACSLTAAPTMEAAGLWIIARSTHQFSE
jgi:hypothetical protein